jgi:hypothetical protein
MGEKCPFCNLEHDKVLDLITDKATKIAEDFTEKSFKGLLGSVQ